MNDQLHNLFVNFVEKFFSFLPSLVVGVVLIILGWILAWFIKRMIIQMSILLKFERTLTRFHWGKAFSKADVRYGLYNFLGNIVFIIVFLLFLYYALLSWGLQFLSELIGEGILLFPRIIAAVAIFGIGWLIAAWSSKSLNKFMAQENIPHATFIAYYTKVSLIVLFSSMAFAELDIARNIVIIGFTTIFITLGVIAVILTTIHGRDLLHKLEESSDMKDPEDRDG